MPCCAPRLSVATHAIVCRPLLKAVELSPKTPTAVLTPEYCDCGKIADTSERDVHPDGAPTSTPSTSTRTVPPPGGSDRRAPGDSTQPKFDTDPATAAPWAGVSIVPNGSVDELFAHVICLAPSSVTCPSASYAKA